MIEFLSGKFLLILAFSVSFCSVIAFFQSSRTKEKAWFDLGETLFVVTTALAIVIGIRLMTLILTHQFQYNYVKHYSSTDLNVFYLVSTFYAGQEGSFLLWIVYTSLIGIVLLRTAKLKEPAVLLIVSLAQLMLLSMLMGVHIPGIGNIGSDPFALTKGDVPIEGDGLNALLQNPWMVIHPPTLFLGFSLLIVPFAYAISAMVENNFDTWIKKVAPWVLVSTAILGAGIFMGGYWAYGVLGWGGFWGWDPVENSSFIPWIITIALVHTIMAQKKKSTYKRTNVILAILAYVFVLYSAFLTRSGVLADYSVHSFTDLGLYNQLLIFVLSFLGIGVGMFIYRFTTFNSQKNVSGFLSKDFFLLLGAITLLFVGIVVAAGTSAPIINRLFTEKPDPILPEFYNSTLLPMAIAIGLLSAIGQLIWWENDKAENFLKIVSIPFVGAVIAMVILVVLGVDEFATGLIIFASLFSLFASIQVFYSAIKKNLKVAGGTIAHIGLALMLIGFVSTGEYGKEKSLDLPINTPVSIFGKTLTFEGTRSLGGGKGAFAIVVQSPNRIDTAFPVLYQTKRMTVQNPDIIRSFNQDFYIAPQNYFYNETPNEIMLAANDGEKMYRGMAVTFLGYNYAKSQLNPSVNESIVVCAKILVKTFGKEEILEPMFEITATRSVLTNPVAIASMAGASVMLKNIDATNKKIVLEFNGLPANDEPLEVLTASVSTKPYISILWFGTLLLIVGTFISVFRRWDERKKMGL